MSETTNQITRREILKRGAFVGGAVVWATPVVQTLGMGRAFAATPSDTCIASWAVEWVEYSPGLRKDLAPVNPGRDQPVNALGAPTPPPNETFVSLGYGGVLILKLGVPYYSGKLGEALVVETTFSAPEYGVERAQVDVSDSLGGTWWPLGVARNDTSTSPVVTSFPLDTFIPSPVYAVRYVRLTDITNDTSLPPNADGFDVNAVGVTCPDTPASPQ